MDPLAMPKVILPAKEKCPSGKGVMQSFPAIETCPRRLLIPAPVMVPPTKDPQLKSGEAIVSWMIDATDSAALSASLETVSGTIADNASRTEAKVRLLKGGFIVFMVALFP
jgi:hypothetical protein